MQQEDGNIRSTDLIKSRSMNGRLNHARPTDSRDLLARSKIYEDRAAAKIQAAYRGYSVRKSLPWLNDKSKSLDDQFNRRVNICLLIFSLFCLRRHCSQSIIEKMLQLISNYVTFLLIQHFYDIMKV